MIHDDPVHVDLLIGVDPAGRHHVVEWSEVQEVDGFAADGCVCHRRPLVAVCDHETLSHIETDE